MAIDRDFAVALLQADRRLSANTAFPKAMLRPSRCSSMSLPGSRPIIPDVFCAALLNSQPMGFYAPAQLVRDAREHGVRVLPVDINHSNLGCGPREGRASIVVRWSRAIGTCWDVIKTDKGHPPRLQPGQGAEREGDRGQAYRPSAGRGYTSVRDLWLRSGLAALRAGEACRCGCVPLDRARSPQRALGGKGAGREKCCRAAAALRAGDAGRIPAGAGEFRCR